MTNFQIPNPANIADGFTIRWNATTGRFDPVPFELTFDIRNYGAVVGGIVDCTSAINAAAIAAFPFGGQVFIDRGVWRTNGLITIPGGVTLTGPQIGFNLGPFEFSPALSLSNVGAMLTRAGTTEANTYKGIWFSLGQQSAAMNLGLYHPFQVTNTAPPVFYDYTFDAPANCHFSTVANIYDINSYRFYRATGENGLTLSNITGYPLSRCITLGRVADVARINNIHWIPTVNGNMGPTLFDWVKSNRTDFVIDGPEQFMISNYFGYGGSNGFEIWDEDGDSFRNVYGDLVNGGLDIYQRCIRVREPNGLTAKGFHMTNVGLVPSEPTSVGVQFLDTHVPATPDETPIIYATNVSFHGPVAGYDRAVWLVTNSHGIYSQTQGSMQNFTNEGMLVQSATAKGRLLGVDMPLGSTRTGGAGTIVDQFGFDL